MAFKWFVAQVYPNCETAAERRLNRQLFATHLPRRTTRVPRRGKIMERAGPCFPGYLFVLLDLMGESWKSACYTRGVLRLRPISERPLPVDRRGIGVASSRVGRRLGVGDRDTRFAFASIPRGAGAPGGRVPQRRRRARYCSRAVGSARPQGRV